MMGLGMYTLNGHTPVLCEDSKTWACWYETADDQRRVARDEPFKGVVVSTVFLALDHRHFGEGPPILFETMVFGGPLNYTMQRCATWDEAETQHAAMVARVIAVGAIPNALLDHIAENSDLPGS
jgi:hypothetical protein